MFVHLCVSVCGCINVAVCVWVLICLFFHLCFHSTIHRPHSFPPEHCWCVSVSTEQSLCVFVHGSVGA